MLICGVLFVGTKTIIALCNRIEGYYNDQMERKMKKFLTITFIKSKIFEKINLTDSYNIVVQTSYSDVAKKLEDPNI